MSLIPNPRVYLGAYQPAGYPVLGETIKYDTESTIDLNAPLNPGQVLVKLLVLSVDPYMRGRMRGPSFKSYAKGWSVDETMYGYAVATVIKSSSDNAQVGDHVYGTQLLMQHYSVVEAANLKVLPNTGLPWSLFVGVLGMPGQTAYFGYKAFIEGKKGKTLFVTTGAGPVGSLVIQLAKAEGYKVIGSAGSADKVKFMQEVGADVAFNYKETSTEEVLEKHGPIDVYWDHVGGEVLDIVLDNMAVHGTMVMCGSASQYNVTERYGNKNLSQIVGKRLTIHGLLVIDHFARFGSQFYKEVPELVKSGSIKYLEHVTKGLENTGRALLEVLEGKNEGKAVVIVNED